MRVQIMFVITARPVGVYLLLELLVKAMRNPVHS